MITHIITTFNRKNIVRIHLQALQDQTWSDFETIVVDDGSSDGTEDLFSSQFPNVMYYKRPDQGYRLASARNDGIRYASDGIVIIADDDMIPDRYYIENFVHAVKPGTVVLGPTVHTRSVPSQKVWHNVNGNIGITKSDIERIGLYDENFTTYGLEDLDLGIRLHKAGMNIVLNEQVWCTEINSQYTISPLTPMEKQSQLLHNLSYLQNKYDDLDELLEGWSFYEWMKQNTTNTFGTHPDGPQSTRIMTSLLDSRS